MVHCPKCSAALIGSGKFCASCGARVAATSDPTPKSAPAAEPRAAPHSEEPRRERGPAPSPISPLAMSDFGEKSSAVRELLDAAAQSERRASAAPAPPAPEDSKRPRPPVSAGKPRTQLMANAPPRPVAQQGAPPAYAPGARVHVMWSNGHRYPATVQQVSGAFCLVVFTDGQQRWVEMQYLTVG